MSLKSDLAILTNGTTSVKNLLDLFTTSVKKYPRVFSPEAQALTNDAQQILTAISLELTHASDLLSELASATKV